MIHVEIYGKQGCHLCEEAHEVLLAAAAGHPFNLDIIELDEHHPRFEELKEHVPVVYINGEFAFQHRVPKDVLLARLRKAAAEDDGQ